MEVTPARALGERPGITSLMLSGDTDPFIMLAAMSSWLCSLTTSAFFSSSCMHHNVRQRLHSLRRCSLYEPGNMLSGESEPFILLAGMSSWLCSLTTSALFSSSCTLHSSLWSGFMAR